MSALTPTLPSARFLILTPPEASLLVRWAERDDARHPDRDAVASLCQKVRTMAVSPAGMLVLALASDEVHALVHWVAVGPESGLTEEIEPALSLTRKVDRLL